MMMINYPYTMEIVVAGSLNGEGTISGLVSN